MIYVDDVGIPATVWNKRTGWYVDSRWYHLISDQLDTAELHAFAARLGLHRSYFQEGKDILGHGPDPGHDHYDVTVGKRKQALALGAQGISWRQLAEITMAKTQAYRERRRIETTALTSRTDSSGSFDARSLTTDAVRAALCPACVHPIAEHEHNLEYGPQPSCEIWTCQHPTCDCVMDK
jgi:hypothetical protein